MLRDFEKIGDIKVIANIKFIRFRNQASIFENISLIK